MNIRSIPFILFALLFSSARAVDFTGTFECKEDGETTTLVLKQTGDTVTGTAKFTNGALDINGSVKSEELVGKATMKGQPLTLFIKATLSNNDLTLKIATDESFSDSDSQVFKRIAGSKTEEDVKEPLKKGFAKFTVEPTEVLKNGKEYVHASGGKFKYPANWEVREGDGYLQLVPPDAKAGEIIIMRANQAEGATDPGSSEILAYLDSQIAESVPDATREGKPEQAVAGAGKGVILNWNGTVEGRKSLIRGYVTIVKNYGIALVAVGSKETVEARDKVLRQVFQSIGWGQGKVDQKLVGTWNYWGYKGSTDGKFGREEKAQCVLSADGKFSYTNSAETNVSVDAGGLSSRRGNGWGGTWTADGATIILNFEDGSSESFSYRFEQQGQNTFLVTGWEDKKNKKEWRRG